MKIELSSAEAQRVLATLTDVRSDLDYELRMLKLESPRYMQIQREINEFKAIERVLRAALKIGSLA
jgi:hypothetical protein